MEKETLKNREKLIVRTSIIGIVANLFLAGFKAFVGVVTHSIAITLDAVNNLSDALSSIITVIGTKLAAAAPDYKHPYGHGRAEYLSAMAISAIILYAGITSLVESIKKIIHPATPDYTVPALIIVSVAIVVKIVLGKYVQNMGRKTGSSSLEASGKDALLDSVISATTLVAAIIYLTAGISVEAYLGAIISLVIIKAGFEMLGETIGELIGARADQKLTVSIKKTITEAFPDISGAYDLVLHNYGPEVLLGSVHIEVPDDYSAVQIDRLSRQIYDLVLERFNVVLTAIGIYPTNKSDREITEIKEAIYRKALSHEHVKNMHGFYMNREDRILMTDIVVGFEAKDMNAVCEAVKKDAEEICPDYTVRINLDVDMND